MQDTIFNFIDSVLFNKKKLNTINEGETEFNIYMVNRWCSMYSPDIAQIINQTSNQYKEVFTLKQDQYNFLFNILPKRKKKKIEYIKKQKVENEKQDDLIPAISKKMELSQREIKEYIDLYNQAFK
jgi:translation initiation factor 2 alpha subunit (eIF-2alpha)